MPLIFILTLLLAIGVCFVLLVWAKIVFCALRRLRGHASNDASAGELGSQNAGEKGRLVPGFRKAHLFISGSFFLVYCLMTSVIWGGYYHSFKSVLMTLCGPFATVVNDPSEEHWKTAWALFPFCAAFLLWGVFCQWVRLPFLRNPGPVALVMWALGLMVWFDAAILSYVLAA